MNPVECCPFVGWEGRLRSSQGVTNQVSGGLRCVGTGLRSITRDWVPTPSPQPLSTIFSVVKGDVIRDFWWG